MEQIQIYLVYLQYENEDQEQSHAVQAFFSRYAAEFWLEEQKMFFAEIGNAEVKGMIHQVNLPITKEITQ